MDAAPSSRHLAPVVLGRRRQQPPLGGAHHAVQPVDGLDQLVVGALAELGHAAFPSEGARGSPLIVEHMFALRKPYGPMGTPLYFARRAAVHWDGKRWSSRRSPPMASQWPPATATEAAGSFYEAWGDAVAAPDPEFARRAYQRAEVWFSRLTGSGADVTRTEEKQRALASDPPPPATHG